MNNLLKIIPGVLVVALQFFAQFPRLARAGDGYDGYYNYLGNWPVQKDTVYAEDIQGIAHSDNFWFITKSGDAEGAVLYKIAVTEDLSNPLVSASVTPGSSGLDQLGYTAYKAMDSYQNPANGAWYLVIGVEGGGNAVGVAVYDESLALKGAAALHQQTAAGWCAIDNAGKIYSGENETSHLNRYLLNWSQLAQTGSVSLQHDGTVILKSASGAPLSMSHYQGGDFTPEGDKLYIVTGYFGVNNASHGIHVFDTAGSSGEFRRIRKSDQGGLFNYSYDPTCSFLDYQCEEPEGLTFWDLTDGRAPNIDGELHVILLDNDADTIVDDDDDIWIKHYTKGIYVDGLYSGSSTGDPGSPDKSVAAGVNRAFDDMELRIRNISYPETPTIAKKLRLVNRSGSGSVVIGE